MFNVVLIEPEIPPNTGNVGRLCLATESTLHLVKPLGFSLEDRQLKRAGLDYWDEVDVRIWNSFIQLQQAQLPGARYFFLTTKARSAPMHGTRSLNLATAVAIVLFEAVRQKKSKPGDTAAAV